MGRRRWPLERGMEVRVIQFDTSVHANLATKVCESEPCRLWIQQLYRGIWGYKGLGVNSGS